jgi:phage gp45-like
MHRATPRSTSFRAFSAGGTRSVVHEVDDSKEMQEGKGNFMKGETREAVESPQNYGFTSVVMDGDKDKDGNLTDGPETFTSFMGGNRSFPVNGPMDDRRHRLKGLDKGDVAMFRTKDDNQQFHLTGDGGFWSAPTDKTVRMQLVKKEDKQQGGQQGGGGGASTRDASGGGGQGGQQGQQGQQSQRGQKAVRKNSSHQYVDVTKDNTNVSGTNTFMRLEDGKGYVHCSADKKVWVGMEKGKAKFARLLTEDGPSVNSYGNLGGGSLREGVELTDDFPPPVIPDRCFYTETTWFDAHVRDDAWRDFYGQPAEGTAPTFVPFHFFRSEITAQVPGAGIGRGSLGLNSADGVLFWLNNAGGVEQAALRNIANVPGLLALMSLVRIVPAQASGSYTFDTRTKNALVFLWGGGAEETLIAGTTGAAGGNTTFLSLAAYGGTGNTLAGDESSNTPGVDGGAAGGLVLWGGGAAGGSRFVGRGGYVIGFLPVTGGSTTTLTVGGPGDSGLGHAGHPGGALIIETT